MATANIIESVDIGGGGHGNTIQALMVSADGGDLDAPAATHTLTFSTSANTQDGGGKPFRSDTRMVSVGVTAAGYIRFGNKDTIAGNVSGEWHGWQPANTLVSYVIDRRWFDSVAVYDGSS